MLGKPEFNAAIYSPNMEMMLEAVGDLMSKPHQGFE